MMYLIELRVQCSAQFSELLPEVLVDSQAVIDSEAMVENVVNCSLLELFDVVYMEEISMSIFYLEGQMEPFSSTM